MAAKEEAAILKYLKKNPSQDALDISFGIDIDEDLVKQALAALEGKAQVESKDVGGRLQWAIAAPKPKAAPAAAAPLAEGAAVAAASKVAKSEAADAESDDTDDDSCCKSCGVSKGFVFGISGVVLALAIGAGYVLGGMQASSAAKALADTEVKNVRDSLGFVKLSLNMRLDNLETQIRDLKAAAAKPEAVEEKKEEHKKGKKAPAKPAKKKRR